MSTHRASSRRFRLARLPNSIFAFLLVFMVASLWVPRFFTPGNLSSLLLQSSIMIILSVAMALVIIAGGIDLSMGSVLSMCGVIMALCMRNGLHALVAIGIGLAIGALFGLLNGLIVTRLRVPPFIATFGSMGIAQSLANTLSGRRTIYWESGSHSSLVDLLKGDVVHIQLGPESSMVFYIPFLVVLTAVVVGGVIFLFRRTVLGAYVHAIGENEEVARLSGIATRSWTTLLYVISGALAGFAGLLMLIRTNSMQPTSGDWLEFVAVVAAVLGGNALEGGKGSLVGAIFGALTLYMVRNALALKGIDTSVTMVVIGAVLVIGMFLNALATRHEKKLSARAETENA
ncbi:ABC transporter permease [Xanthobacteraceae bacterium Astr-EGSB]|uniref:ABC transporter permease n=1 Tax=Astrobacterium formosum TaxID=3069710 RepID=UPI0027B04823|nr:ABC transporter permease [Xanthobacteraceae bacterium Astr-EGSB]